MKTFYEEILRVGTAAPLSEPAQLIMTEMRNAEVVDVQNVAEYFYEVSDQENWDISTDFPNLAPPFPAFWMEYVFPKVSRSGEHVIPMPMNGMRVGLLFLSKEPPMNARGVKWGTFITLFIRWEGAVKKPCQWSMALDAEGKLASYEDGVPQFWAHLPPARSKNPRETQIWEARANLCALWPALLAISFMHCKNVNLYTREPKRELGKRARRNAAKIRYHTLHIEPMKKVLRSEGGSEETGIKHALHICRGHFKDFTKGKGLFGKFKDIYWWDSQVRGSADQGVVLKDYSVDQPAQDGDQ
jgi:hypothetical protein